MRTIHVVLVALCALGFSACGDKDGETTSGGGGGAKSPAGVVGSWAADMPRFLDDLTRTRLDELAKEKAAKPETEVPSRETVHAGVKEMFGGGRLEATFNADGTVSVLSQDPGDPVETTLGTWVQTGDQVVATPKTRDGKPVTGSKAEVKTLTLKGNVLALPAGEGLVIYLNRK